MKKILLFYTLISPLLSGAQTFTDSLIYGGLTRTYSYYIPTSYQANHAVPLILNLHGHGSNGNEQSIYAHFNPIADTASFIVLSPDGTFNPNHERFWNIGLYGSTVDDIGFLETLIDTLSAHYTINSNRIYAVGMSNGGYMSYMLACQTNRFAAIASVAGSMSVPMYHSCFPANPVPVIDFHGTGDSIVPYVGNAWSKEIETVIQTWAQWNSCNLTPTVHSVPDIVSSDGVTAEHYIYAGGTHNHSVEFFKLIGGGHTWPGSIPIPMYGNTCQDFSATQEIWRFFSQYEKINFTYAHTSISQDFIQMERFPNYLLFKNPISEKWSVRLIDIQGHVIEKQKTDEKSILLPINDIENGMYFIEIETTKQKWVKKILLNS